MTKKKRINRLKDPYRLILLREDTLAEVGSYRLSILNLYILVCTLLVLIVGGVVSLIMFTPVKRMIPGYGDITESTEYINLYNRVKGLEKQLEAQRLYTDTFRKLITGEVDTNDVQEIPQKEQGDKMDFKPTFNQESKGTDPDVSLTEDKPLVRGVKMEDNQGTNSKRLQTPHLAEYLFFIPPVRGKISAGFDAEIDHYGVDILAPKDTPIKAILDGHVIASDWTLETGNTIGIQHSNNIVSFYKHNSINLKKLGSSVKAGEAVAIIGNTGSISSGPHLHFELWMDGKPMDPVRFIEFD